MNGAAKLVGQSLAQTDYRTVVVGDRAYVIFPPTIRVLAGAAACLAQVDLPKEGATVRDVAGTLSGARQWAAALSWFIRGDEELAGRLSEAPAADVVQALEVAVQLLSPQVFFKAVGLTASVCALTAARK